MRGSWVFIVDVCPRPRVYNIIFTRVFGDMPNFSFHARYALLTFPQCDGLDPWSIVSHLTTLEAECIVGRESHADGNTHLHVFADFGRKRKFRRADIFDVDGFHPNIAPSRGTPGNGWDYATKDGDIVAGGLIERPSDGQGLDRNGSKFHQIIGAETEDQYWELIRDLAPELLLRNYASLKSYASHAYAAKPLEYVHPENISFIDARTYELDGWREENLAGLRGPGR